MPEEQKIYEQLRRIVGDEKGEQIFGTSGQVYGILERLGYVPREPLFPSYKGGKPLSQKEQAELLKEHKEVLEALRKKGLSLQIWITLCSLWIFAAFFIIMLPFFSFRQML